MRAPIPRFETLARKRRKYPAPPLVLSPPPHSIDRDRREEHHQEMSGGRATPRYAPEDPSLPKPWRGLVDGSTGYLYYWNPDTDVTQYERPLPLQEQLPSPPPFPQSARRGISSAAVAAPDRRRRRSYSPDEADDRYAPRAKTFHQGGGSRGGSMDVYGLNDARDPRAVSIGSGRDYSTGVDAGSAEVYRQRHEIIVIGDNVPAPFPTFDSANLPPEILKELLQAGFPYPTPIQAQSWPIALEGNDIVAVAKTGSGKTLGYLLPGFIRIKRLRNDPRVGPTVLVLAPTRELATQIEAEVVKFSRSAHISCTCLYGGAPKVPQLKALERGVDIVVATPGRLWDIMEMRRLSLRQVSYLVLDEADRMLDMGFEPEIRRIIKEVPQRHQTLMFTATWPKEVRAIAGDLLVRPVQVNIGRVDELVANSNITQNVEVTIQTDKLRRVEQILRSQERGAKVLIFCITKRMCDQLALNLVRQFPVAVIHGDKSQGERERVLNQFRSGRTPILIATDIAARGLDIKDIRTVINYDFPTGIEDYVHRIGRTGRAGATGVAYTFFCQKEARFAKDLIKILEVAKQRVPRELRALALQGGGGRRPARPIRGWRPVDSPTNRAAAGGLDRERNSDYLSGRGRAPEPVVGRFDGDRRSHVGYDSRAPYASNGRYNGVDVGDEKGHKVGDKVPRERDSSYNRYRSPSPKRARPDYPPRNIRSPQRARSDYLSRETRSPSPKRDRTGPPHNNRSPSPERDRTGYPPCNNRSPSPMRDRTGYPPHNNRSPSPKRDRSNYPSRNNRSPSPKMDLTDYPPRNNRSPSPKRNRTDYPSRDNHSPSPKRNRTDYPSRHNHSLSPKRNHTDYPSRDNYSSSPKRDRSDYPSRSPRKSRASYEDANSRSPSPNLKRRSRDHSPSKSRSRTHSLSPDITRDSASPNPKKLRGNVRSRSRSPSRERSLSHSPSRSNSPYLSRSRSAGRDQSVDQADSPLVSDVRHASVSPPESPRNANSHKQGSPYGYSDQERDANGGNAGDDEGIEGEEEEEEEGEEEEEEEEGEEEGVDILAGVD